MKWFEEDKVVEGAKSTCNCSNCLRDADSKTCEPLLAPADLLPDRSLLQRIKEDSIEVFGSP